MDTVTYPDHRVTHMILESCIPVRIHVRQEPAVAEEYQVHWTPNVVIADENGTVHSRIEGYLPPEQFMARLALALGRYDLDRKQFAEARQQFEEVAQRHKGSEAGAEALYWLAVAQYKESHDAGQLKAGWQRLIQEYPNSVWATRANVPG